MAWKTALIFGCIHRPVHDEEFCGWLVNSIRERQPDIVVCNGDLFDQKCVSRFAKLCAPTLEQEYQSADEFLTAINDTSAARSRSSLVFMEGNHCSRIFREEHGHLAALLDFRKHVPSLKRWDTRRRYYQRPEHAYTLGQVTVAHSWSTSQSGIRREAMNLGVPGGLYVMSHTHRGHQATRLQAAGSTELPYWVANTGCGISGDENYFREWDVSRWNRGFVWVSADPGKRNRNTPHWQSEFVEHSRFW